MQPPARIPHVPALDGVRGAAVVAVLFFHAGHLSGGFLGVDLFFTLSGFLITSLLLAEWRSAGTISLGRFWARRARRLLPAVLVMVAAVGLYAWLWAQAIDLGTIRDDGLATLAYVANWHSIAAGRGYWDSFSAPSPFEHAWSLAIEEQFYVIWPLLVVGVFRWVSRSDRDGERRDPAPTLFGITMGLAVASAATMVVLHHRGDDPSRVYLGSDTRTASILIGAALSLLLGWRGPVRSRTARLALEGVAVAASIALVWAWAVIDGTRSNGLFEGGMALCALAAAAVIASIVHPQPMVLARLLAFAPLRWAGLISYGLYLWHWPLFVLLSQSRTDLTGWPLVWLRLGVSVAVAVVSYYVVEQPIRRGALAGWKSRASVPVGFALSTGVLIASTAGAVAAPSFDITAPTPTTAATTTTVDATGTPTATTGPGATTLPPATQPLRVLVVGDSVGWTIAKGMEAVATERGITVENDALFGCGVARGDGTVRLRDGAQTTETDQCRDSRAMWSTRIDAYSPTDVVLALGAWDVADRLASGKWVHPCQATFDAQYTEEITASLGVLGATGARVHVLTFAPLRGEQLGLSNSEMDRRTDCLNDSIAAAVALNSADGSMDVDVIDIAAWTCPDGDCPSRSDGVLLRPDGVHYDGDGGPAAARGVLDQLERWRAAHPSTAAGTTATTPSTAVSASTPSPAPSSPATSSPATGAAAAVPLVVDRTIAAGDPLRVLIVGDSFMYDASPAVTAALGATGRAEIVEDSVLGFSLEQRPDWTVYDWRKRWAADIDAHRPDVVVAMWGIWDEAVYARLGAQGYRQLLDESLDMLQSGGARVILLGVPPVPATAALSGASMPSRSVTVTAEFRAAAAARPGTVAFVDLDDSFTVAGRVSLIIDGQRVRKPDLEHFCPQGAAHIARAVLSALRPFGLPVPVSGWESGTWTGDQRYDNPSGACAGT